MSKDVRIAVRATVVLTLIVGIVYPAATWLLAQVLFPEAANGSLVWSNGSVIGSRLIGQTFTGPGYMHPRPSGAGNGYDPMASGGTNLGPTSRKLIEGDNAGFEGVIQLAARVREDNGLPPDAWVPVDAVTRSGSGLDPDITPAYAALQVPRIARARRLREDAVRALVAQATVGRQLGVLGEPRVNVLAVNQLLDAAGL